MTIDLDKFKGKTLDSETLAEVLAVVNAHADPLEARALKAEDKARKAAQESIDGRKGKDSIIAKALERLGIDSPDDLDSLPDAKGQAEATKQIDAKLKRVERELADKAKAFDELIGKYNSERRERAIAEQVAKHPFIDAEDVRALVSGRLKEEGDELLFSGPDGKTVPLADGVAWMAKTKTHLVRPAGGGASGSGFRPAHGGGGEKNPFLRASWNLTEQIAMKHENPGLAAQLEKQAQQAA